MTKISHFWTWISPKPVGQSWSNFMCSIIRVGERLHKVARLTLAHWTQVSDRCPLGYLLGNTIPTVYVLHPIFEPPLTKPTKCLCAQKRLRLAWVSIQSDQSLRCPHEESFGPELPTERTAKDSDQTGRMPRLIRVFAGRTVILLILSWGGSYQDSCSLLCLLREFFRMWLTSYHNSPKIWTPEKIAIIILKLEQHGFTIEQWVQKM